MRIVQARDHLHFRILLSTLLVIFFCSLSLTVREPISLHQSVYSRVEIHVRVGAERLEKFNPFFFSRTPLGVVSGAVIFPSLNCEACAPAC